MTPEQQNELRAEVIGVYEDLMLSLMAALEEAHKKLVELHKEEMRNV